jgi:glutamate-5-semialdehyde dehydrogenase
MTASPIEILGAEVKVASRDVARSSGATRQAALRSAAAGLRAASGTILEANEADLSAASLAGLSATAMDRLRLDAGRLEAMAVGLETVAGLPDPVGATVAGSVRPNGLKVTQVRRPLGVIGVIYENRPNVTSDAAGLCLASGNAAFLRGSSSSIRSNVAITEALRAGLLEVGLPEAAITLVEDTSHETAAAFMQLEGVIDCLIPRGGPSLIASMREHATVPYVLDGDGNCHVYVDRSADLTMATRIIVNAKTQRPGVCNAMESLVLHSSVAEDVLERLASEMPEVRLLGDARACALRPDMEAAAPEDFSTEFLDLVATVRVVDDLDEAIDHINRHSSGHSEAIVTSDVAAAERFLDEVEAAAVLLNASTRFVDGSELGLGAEVGISTQKIHARGPMGLEALTSIRWVIRGEGQTRT